MDLHYGICYYYGKNKVENIINHFKVFQNIPQPNKFFWVVFTIDNNDPKEREKICQKELGRLKNNEVHYLHDFNWGGTVAAMHHLFQHLHKTQPDAYLAFFEEDFTAKNKDWFNDCKKYLPGNYYIGEGTIQNIENNDLCQVKVCDTRYMVGYKFIKSFINEVWTDGGFYFSTLSNFKKIYDKIGIFHKGDQKTKYNHGNDGIDLGEVGFPSAVFNNGMKFAGLYRHKYFVHK